MTCRNTFYPQEQPTDLRDTHTSAHRELLLSSWHQAHNSDLYQDSCGLCMELFGKTMIENRFNYWIVEKMIVY